MCSRSLLLFGLFFASSLVFANTTHESDMDPADMITIQPHSRSSALNAKHAAACAEIGGIDISQDTTMQLSKSAVDGYACKIVDEKKYDLYAKAKNASGHSNVVTQSQSVHGQISTAAPSGYYFDSPFYAEGYTIFTGDGRSEGLLRVEVYVGVVYPGSCSNRTSVKLPKDTVNEKISVIVGCGMPKNTPSWPTYTDACEYFAGSGDCNPYSHQRPSDNIYFADKNNMVEHSLGNISQPPSCNLPSSYVGNPINASMGNKFQQEIDISVNGGSNLNFIRGYNSVDGLWRHNYSMRLENLTKNVITLVNADGRVAKFTNENGIIKSELTEFGTLKKISDGYQYTSAFHQIYDFDSTGRVVQIIDNGGKHENFHYISATEFVVSDELGNSLTITETKDHQPLSVKSSYGIDASYEYDSQNRLIKATVDGATKSYHYEDNRFPRALTSITNERGIRYVTWTYDDKGRANSSSHAGGKDKVDVVYNSDIQSTIINPLGRKYTYNYAVIDGLKRISSITGAPSSLCPAINSSYQYNTRGLVTLKTDGKGIQTKYEYNDAGQETSRTIGYGKPEALTIKTIWDKRFNLPKYEIYPHKTIEYEYDDNGNLELEHEFN